MLEDRPDWCISRQRDWGVPIAFFIDKAKDEPIYDEKVLNYIAMIFEQRGCDAWYDLEIKDLLYPGSKYNPDDLIKSKDILDVWFDSGSTQFCVLKSRLYDSGTSPADIYLEGSDQHRGWFQSSLLTSMASCEVAPYKAIITHGFTMDKNGEKMSKSKGNVLLPSSVTKQYGSEILRLWVATSDYQNDQKISDDILKQVAEQYRKIRNTFRFLFANIGGLEQLIDTKELQILDKWILVKTKKIFLEIDQSFTEYNFSKGFQRLNGFLGYELSGIYLDICKDLLYCDEENSISRYSARSTMSIIASSMITLLAPFLTYTMDELLEYAPKSIKGESNDIFDFQHKTIPDVKINFDEKHLLKAREVFFEKIDILKKNKTINNTLELELFTDSKELLDLSEAQSQDWFIVSSLYDLKALDGEKDSLAEFEVDNKKFIIAKSPKHKCPRCWKYKTKIEDGLCERCDSFVNN
jgi:isoleucyl-tRNA synthetase